jgi:hypothetical protein
MKNLNFSPSKDQKRYAQLWVQLELTKQLEHKERKE